MPERPLSPNRRMPPPPDPDTEDSIQDATTFQWDFEATARAADVTSHQSGYVSASYATHYPDRAVSAQLVTALERALDRWWAVGDLPSANLLRDGLRYLADGGHLPPAVCALLLRTALLLGRGWQTALRLRGDDELAAVVTAETLATGPALPIETDLMNWVNRQGDDLAGWRVAFRDALRQLSTVGDAATSRRASGLLRALDAGAPPDAEEPAMPKRQAWPRRLLLLLLLLGMIAAVLWMRTPLTPAGMIAIPAGTYELPWWVDDGPVAMTIVVDTFAVDIHEVTNREYRRCVDRGSCPAPASASVGGLANYFLDPAFDGHPVANVNQSAAAAYCTWAGKRLPSAAEWLVAAGHDPATGQTRLFPWGSDFAMQITNAAPTGIGHPLPIGSFRPAGDSAFGMADMAGNVAEWTSDRDATGELVMVKGGSYADAREMLQVAHVLWVNAERAEPWLGFRCAASMASRWR